MLLSNQNQYVAIENLFDCICLRWKKSNETNFQQNFTVWLIFNQTLFQQLWLTSLLQNSKEKIPVH